MSSGPELSAAFGRYKVSVMIACSCQSLRLRIAIAGVLSVFASPPVVAGAAPASRSSESKAAEPSLKPVDPGVADVDPLASSGRVLPKDLRQPANFDRVYEVELEGKRYFVRAHGGVYAVFPRSDYVQTRRGAVPIVPAGTVFHLGTLPKNEVVSSPPEQAPPNPANARPARPGRQDQAAPSNAAPTAESAAAQPALTARPSPTQRQTTEPPNSEAGAEIIQVREESTIWTSEMVRVGRAAALLEKARSIRAQSQRAETVETSADRQAGAAEASR